MTKQLFDLTHSIVAPHPRTVGWFGTTAVAMGGINQSLFLLGALFVGQGAIPGQGSAAVVLLGIGLILSWMATPGWVELILMYPNRVGGIAATCAEAFRPYSPVLANLTGVCYWWGWVPTCGLTALLASSAINQWYLPSIPVPVLAAGIVLFFTFINLCGVKWVMRLAMPIASLSAILAFASATIPIFSGSVDWQQAFTFHLTVPFDGYFGQITSVMAGLYLIGFAAPAFEQASCHVGETINPNKNVPRAMYTSAALASLYFIVLPLVWLGALGPVPLGKELALELGPTFAPLLGGAAKATAIWFMIFNMLHGTIAPLAGAARTLAQLSEDGLLPESFAKRTRTDAPWVATLLTATMAILFLFIGDPVWLIAAANLTYLIGIAMPSVAVWLLRRNEPHMTRPYRAPRGTIILGLVASAIWGLSVLLGFQQFGLTTVLIGFAFAYSGSILYAWRKYIDRRKAGLPGFGHTLHLKLTGAMLIVLALDSAGYLLAVSQIPRTNIALITALEDIFVVVALLTFAVGLILPGMIAHSAVGVSKAINNLVNITMIDFERAMHALAAGDLDNAKAKIDFEPIKVFSRDEVSDMAMNFNLLLVKIKSTIEGLSGAREGLIKARSELNDHVDQLRIAATAFESQEGIVVTDVKSTILRVNHAFSRITGYSAEEVIGQTTNILDSDRHGIDFYTAMWKNINNTGTWEGEVWNRRKNGEVYPEYLSITAVKNLAGVVTNYVVTFIDITISKAAEEEINLLAFYDPLTKLPNRRLLLDRLKHALLAITRSGKQGALLFLDLDHFKTVNDSLGHYVGDLLLQQTADRLTASVREGDTVARLGGDEFVVLLEGLSEQAFQVAAQTTNIAEKILLALNQPFQLGAYKCHTTISIGATLFNEHSLNMDELLKQADIAMYQSKTEGRNTVRFFDPMMQAVINVRADMGNELREAIVQHQFQLYYQIQVDSSVQALGAEALIRWHHPERGIIPPNHFILLAEDTGLILPIGQWVLDTACAQLKQWQHNTLTQDLILAVNVSAKQFHQEDFTEQVKATLKRHDINPARLKLELTESLLVENINDIISKMNVLREIGINFSLDDFGVGYSSLQYLKKLPLNQLKIDQSFVRDIMTNISDRAIVDTIIAMASKLDLNVIAEGVETVEQYQLLLVMGCTRYQGYLFSKPVPIGEFEALLGKNLLAV